MSAEVKHHAERIPEWKVKEVDELVKQINETPVFGLVGMADIPATQIQKLRADLREIVTIRMVRNNIARRAIGKCSADVKPLADHIDKQTAFIFSDLNPFKLSKMLLENKTPMPLRAGSTAPIDIVIEAGDTPFSPGPMVGTLQSAGIPAAIKSGKVVITETKTVVKEGDTVSAQLAEVLALMEIYPREVGLDPRAIYEGGLLFKAEDLSLDVEGMLSQMSMAAAQAFGLAIEIGYFTPETIGPIVQSAAFKARNLVLECAIPVPSMAEELLAKAAAQASTINTLVEGGDVAEPGASTAKEAGAEEKDEQVEETEKEDDDAGMGGLSALFG